MQPREPRRARIYAALPAALQSVAVSLEGCRLRRERLGGSFGERLRDYLQRERASSDEVLAVRRQRLRVILVHAVREIPHWREVFHRAGVDPSRVDGPDDLCALPILTKSEILRLAPRLRWSAAPSSLVRTVHTSGTTGAGLVFATSLDAIRDQWAVWWRYRIRHGLELTTWGATFGGRTVVPGATRNPPFWRVNRAGRQVLYSQYHLGPGTVSLYLHDLSRRHLPWLHGYPSVLSLLGSLAVDHHRGPLPRPRVITLGAENLLAAQRRVIHEAFGAEPVQHYGLAEAVANASQCPAGYLHIDEDFAAVELLPAGDGRYRIVGTALENRAMPFIRYDTGDLARPLQGPCSCGLPGRVLREIDGRQEDLLTLSDGTRVGRLDHLFKDMVHVAEAQIRQSAPGHCVIAIVPREGFKRRDEELLLVECKQRFGDRLKAHVEVVSAIERAPSGKLRLVIHEAITERSAGVGPEAGRADSA